MENNSIDKTFNEASKTLEEPATFPGFEKVWAKVEEKLDKKEEKRRKIIPIWLPYGIAASLLIGSGIFYFTNKKENANIQEHVIAKNIISQKDSSVNIPEHIQKTDSTVKANIQNEILPEPPVKIAYNAIPSVYSAPAIPSSDYIVVAPSISQENAVLPVSGDRIADTLRKQNIEEVIAMGIRKEKASMVHSLAETSTAKKKIYGLNAVADTAEAAYPIGAFDLKQETQEPEILAFNKGYLKSKQPIAGNYSGFANKIGNKETVNSIRGTVPGVNINSISGKPGSGKVDISISCEGSNKSPLFVVNGKATDSETFRRIDPKKIESMRVFKAETATSLFGDKAVNGAVLVETKDISKKEKRMLKKLLKKEKLLKK